MVTTNLKMVEKCCLLSKKNVRIVFKFRIFSMPTFKVIYLESPSYSLFQVVSLLLNIQLACNAKQQTHKQLVSAM